MSAPTSVTQADPKYQRGDVIADRYTVVRPIGSGGMGVVYEVESKALGHRLAMKVMTAQFLTHRTVVKRFKQEALIQATISHPGVARVFDLLEHDGQLAIVMELIPFPTLKARIAEGPLQSAAVRQIATDLLSTLAECHNQNVVHRDLKPDNIFVMQDAAGVMRCKLADFGIAKLLSNSGEKGMTKSHTFIGTYAYASPEQITSSSAVDQRSDLYSLGVVLWQTLTGIEPYANLDSAYSIQVAVVSDALPDLPATVDSDLRRVIAEVTRKDPDERPASATEVLKMLGAAVSLDRATKVDSDSDASPDPVLQPSPPKLPSPPTLPNSPATQVDAPALRPAQSRRQQNNRRKRQLRQVNQQRVLALRPAPLMGRILARCVDEFLLQLLVLSCLGIVIYPFAALLRGCFNGQGLGEKLAHYEVVNSKTGLPASTVQMLARNAIDLCMFQFAIALIVWPFGWLTGFVITIVGILWLFSTGTLEILVALGHPQGRRLADLITSTRVCRI
jgi:serine/threonine protein kinase